MIISVLVMTLGLILLVWGANSLIEGASVLAKRLGVSALIIGLTVVAFGTSLPEMVINLIANAQGASNLAIGNVLGSNVTNILLVLGISAIIQPLVITRQTVWREIFFGVTATSMFIVLVADHLFGAAGLSELTRSDGIVLISYFAILMYYSFGPIRIDQPTARQIKSQNLSLTRALIRLMFGLTGLLLGAQWVVSGAIDIATALNISESLIGLTIVAIGTSLPELAAGVTAAFKKEVGIAVGAVVGSNLFNIFWVLGVNATIRPIVFNDELFIDAIVALMAALLLFLTMFFGKGHVLRKWHGQVFVSLYVVYIIYLVWRG